MALLHSLLVLALIDVSRGMAVRGTRTAYHSATWARMVIGDRPRTAPSVAPTAKKVNIPDYVRRVLEDPRAPKRTPESAERIARVRERAREAMIEARNIAASADDSTAWWSAPLDVPDGGRVVTAAEPLRVLVAGGGLAGLIVAAACHAKGMKVAIFEQAGSYAPYGGPIQIQSNALRALRRINEDVYQEIVRAGTVTADRVSGLKIGYDAGNTLAGKYEKGDWLVRFDTVGPAIEAGLPPTVVVDRPVIQQIFVKHGFDSDAVRIRSRVAKYDKLGKVHKAVARAPSTPRALDPKRAREPTSESDPRCGYARPRVPATCPRAPAGGRRGEVSR
jgi:hypothetical protein